ncbi:Nramp family divalent metal transporter [Actinomadura physcomitrii]|nr:Nramp family divalent metal transporter [Actinomadura physcomitrii]
MRTEARRGPALLGPAFVAAVAYVDPGNVATNVTAGADHGYTLVWVVLLANAMAIPVQYLSAKLGIVTGRSLAGHLGHRLPRRMRLAYWLQAEAIAMATDLAEVVGGAIALALLFDVPLVLGAILTVAVSLAVLKVGDARGQRSLERLVMCFLALIAVGFLAGLVVDPPPAGALAGGLVPAFAGADSVLLASGIIGATVMPHVIYLHSSLTAARFDERGRGLAVAALLRATRVDVVSALLVAGLLNLSLLVVAATSLHGLPGTGTLAGVHDVVASRLGGGVALVFAVALLSSGLASTSVGSAAGAEVMKSLLKSGVPAPVRRIVTVVPALLILGTGTDPTVTLVASQVALSLGIPFALVPLVVLTARRDVMGEHANRRPTTIIASAIAAVVIGLNGVLLYLVSTGR